MVTASLFFVTGDPTGTGIGKGSMQMLNLGHQGINTRSGHGITVMI